MALVDSGVKGAGNAVLLGVGGVGGRLAYNLPRSQEMR
jgi:hypothetical protein